MNINIDDYYDIKTNIECDIRQLKLELYDKQFKLSEIKNVIRKNCIHEWKETDLEIGHSSFNETKCVKCDTTINNKFDKLTDILLT
jgi:hypothetical protein